MNTLMSPLMHESYHHTRIYPHCRNWLKGFTSRIPITLTGGLSGAQNDYQTLFDVSYETAMQPNFDDLRFTQTDGKTLIDGWLESKIDSTSAKVWVETDTPANTVDEVIYMYYGNAGIVNNWDIGATFPFGEDFSGNLDKWDTNGSPTIISGKVELTDDDKIMSKTKFGYGYAFEARSIADEQDVGFITARETLLNEDNVLYLMNSDGDSNDNFDEFKLYTKCGGLSTTMLQDNWNDFRTQYRRYSIYRPIADDVTFVQEAYSYHLTVGNIPTVDLGLSFYVWDSSQESKLTIDWGFVRKYVTSPATYAFGSEERY